MQAVITDETKQIHQQLSQLIGESKYRIWFEHSTRLRLTDDALEVTVANPFVGSWIENHFIQQIRQALKSSAGSDKPVRFEIDPALSPLPPTTLSTKHGSTGKTDSSLLGASQKSHRPPLKLTLETFVVGPRNQLAYNAALTVIQQEKSPFNPLFYHGGYGLGKTHLLQGICNEVAKLRNGAKWLYVSAEDFANQYVLALKTRKLDYFRNRFRSLDLLAIDDIHFLAHKNAMQEEFLHTFNSIDLAGKQIVLASDAHPKMIGQLCEKLISRFVSGMVVKIDPPDFQTRCRICQKRAEAMGQSISIDVIEHIASQASTNVRELEGALVKLVAFAAVSSQKITLPLAKQVLIDHIARTDPMVHSADIVAAIGEFFGVSAAEINSAKKDRTISLARSFCMYLARRLTKMSFPEIGKTIGNKNHATVILACRRIESAIEKNQRLQWRSGNGYRFAQAKDVFDQLMELIS